MPNPFNPSTTVRFVVGTTARVRVDVIDVRGRKVRVLEDARLEHLARGAGHLAGAPGRGLVVPAAEVADALRDLWAASDPTPSQRYLPYAAAFGDTECDSSETLGQVPTTDFDNDCGGPASVIDPSTDLPAWIVDNDWLELVVYHVDPECTLAQRNCAGATLSLDGAPGLHAVVAVAGRPFSGQARPGSAVGDYLDDPGNTGGGNTTYTDQPLTLTDNDNFAGIPAP